MTAILTPYPFHRMDAIADGFVFECSCGELYCDVNAAYSCRKCRNYCVFGYCTHVVDISTGDVVAGEVPEYEEYEAARVRAEAKWAEEKAQLDFNTQMWLKEGELYEAELARLAEVAALEASELAEDIAYATQDKLMGF